ncbi:MAG: patatin-like phospholipase family protein [Bryobacteraceae bacterium]
MARTALVLSAGGLFGAYQAGVWKALADRFDPDLIVGASIGALNGWAIAGRCDPDELIQRWLRPQPLSSWGVRRAIREIHERYQPRIEYGAVVTDALRLRPKLVRDVSWRHLVASAAIPGLSPPPRIDGRYYCDGGLLCALPLWAAVEMGAERIVAINALPVMPNAIVRNLAGAIRRLARFRPIVPESIEVIHIAPSEPLGSVKDALYWNRENAERWIKCGTHIPACVFETLNGR